jgi:hypothetical protein
MMKHGLYKGVQRYICRPCNSAYVKSYRTNTVPTDAKRVPTERESVPTDIDDVDTETPRAFSLTSVNFNA